jgi:3-isopropylmalate/(R)-2-methylmalate dehydratase large subunit
MPRAKIPTKAELIQLQRLYKTDEKIAERLGGATPQLIAYWRRKKNISRHSFPKFSEQEIREIWGRYGDDYRCGLELGISKAAFYNWRRKYKIKEKPVFLKLEQLELNLDGPSRAIGRRYNYGRLTIAQKIIASKIEQEKAEVGETVNIEPDLAVTHIDSGQVTQYFKDNGYSYVWNSSRIVIALNHVESEQECKWPAANKSVRDFVKRQNIKHFYDIGHGACHHLVIETAQILPGQFAVGTDPYINSYGCIGAYTSYVAPSEMAVIWATGKMALTVPESIRIIINGKPPRGVYPKDIALFAAKSLRSQNISNKAIEFYGSAVSQMSVTERFTLCHFTAGIGAVASFCAFDSAARRFLAGRVKMPYRPALADKDAQYADSFELNIAQLTPLIARLGKSDNVMAVSEIEGAPIQQVIIGSCAGARFEDLRIVADLIKGKRINPDVRLLIYPGSRLAYLEALKKGLIRALVEAGALVMNPGCGPCKGTFQSVIAPGEKCLTTAGVNPGIESDISDAEIYVVSPATAAASALRGVITDPSGFAR